MDKLGNLSEERLTIENDLLNEQSQYLTKLKMHDHSSLIFNSEREKVKLDNELLKSKVMIYQNGQKKLDEIGRIIQPELSMIERSIKDYEMELTAYRKLDSKLLSEYQMLMEDLEYQDLLIEYSNDNSA